MKEEALVVFTAKSRDACIRVGGTQSWVLNRAHANRCQYVVLCQNRYTEWGDGKEPHGTGFLVASIADIVPSTETPNRWLVLFDRYAEINVPGAWKGWRNPVRYKSFEELGINLDGASFRVMPERSNDGSREGLASEPNEKASVKAEVESARQRISSVAGVPIAAVKISIEFGI